MSTLSTAITPATQCLTVPSSACPCNCQVPVKVIHGTPAQYDLNQLNVQDAAQLHIYTALSCMSKLYACPNSIMRHGHISFCCYPYLYMLVCTSFACRIFLMHDQWHVDTADFGFRVWRLDCLHPEYVRWDGQHPRCTGRTVHLTTYSYHVFATHIMYARQPRGTMGFKSRLHNRNHNQGSQPGCTTRTHVQNSQQGVTNRFSNQDLQPGFNPKIPPSIDTQDADSLSQ